MVSKIIIDSHKTNMFLKEYCMRNQQLCIYVYQHTELILVQKLRTSSIPFITLMAFKEIKIGPLVGHIHVIRNST
jgi:hypothetical protein